MANGALGALSAWLENNKRVARRQLGDLMNTPDDFGRMQAARFREDQQKYMEDPASGLDFVGGPLGALAGVIKNKGGNWLTGSVENALKSLRKYAAPSDMELMRNNLAAQHPDIVNAAALRELLPNVGPMRRTFEGDIAQLERRAAADQGRWQRELTDMERNASLNNWVEGPLTKYIKTQMATPEDPVRLLAERRSGEVDNILTVAQKEAAKQLKFAEKLKAEGPRPGMPPGTWETAVERAESNAQRIMEDAQAAADIQRTGILHHSTEWVPEADFARRKADEFVRTPGLNSPGSRLGKTKPAQDWEDLTDSAINQSVAEDMLRYMEINPEFAAKNMWLQKVDSGSPVYDIPNISTNELGFDHLTDELRNALNPESGLPANLLLRPDQLSQMGIEKAVAHVGDINRWRAAQKIVADRELANKASLVREYAENNPKGLRWVELKTGEVTDDVLSKLSAGDRRAYDRYLASGDSPIEALRAAAGDENPLVEELEKQLKYEGDTMGHCVGGYCPDVLEGRSRIFSLRDAKGEPHVTVEITPSSMGPEEELGDRIVQIKGKQNKAPNPEYLPFVQDFVKNSPIGGTWGTVGDLQNTGLRFRHDVFSPTELDYLKTRGVDPSEYLLQNEIDEYQKLFGQSSTDYANGGLVNNPFGDVTPKAMLNRIIDVYNQL